MSFRAAITTNYDQLLEHLRDKWQENTLTLNDPPRKKDFVVKLYGNVREPRTLLLSRTEFDAAMATSSMALTLAQAMETKSILFIGCSIEGLLADLNRFKIGPTPTSTHFALVGVSSPGWTAAAEQLSRRYGIELLACAEDKIGQALPAFLERLAENVKQLEAGESVAAQAN